MEELIDWLNSNKISFIKIDNEVIEIEDFGKMFFTDLSNVHSIFKGKEDDICFNLMETPSVLMEEGINYVVFKFGFNWFYYDLREDFKFNILKYIGKRKVTQIDIPYVNLGVHTPYELLNGSGDLSLWIKKAKFLGHPAIGICDRNTMAATLNLQKECSKAGIKHVFGYSFTLSFYDDKVDMKIYCLSQKGLKNLLRIQKEIMVDSENNTITLSQLLSRGEGNILVFGKLSSYWMKSNLHVINELEDAFDKVFYQVDLSEYKADRIDTEVLHATKYYFDNFYFPEKNLFSIEPILICDNYYPDQDEAKNKIILNKIAEGAAHEQSNDQYFKDIDEHYEMFQSLFDPEKWDIYSLLKRMCKHTIDIANNAEAYFETGKMYMPEYIMLPEEKKKYGDRHNMFLDLLEEGLETKIPKENHDKYRKRLEEEVYIIESTNNVDYFLVQWDMVNEARKRGIVTGIGRGSAGGSLVSYLLGIISIDPIKYDLIFSRFLVPERCGLNWVDNVTIIGDDIEIKPNETYVELKLEGDKIIKVFRDAEVRIKRDDKEMTVYADELIPEDDIIIDNKDIVWTINEI